MASYIDLAIKRQAMLERLKSGLVRDYAKEIKKIERLVRSTLLGLEGEIDELNRVGLNKLLRQLQKDQGVLFAAATESFLSSAGEVAALYMAQELTDLERTVDLRGTRLNDFTQKSLFNKVIQRPLTTDGQLLKPWLDDFTERETVRVNNAIRNGWAQGKTNQELVTEIIGTKARGFKDGIIQTTRRNASAVVRTSTQHVASAARQEVWEANRDVVELYQFLSTLDRVTTHICRTLDGEKFEFGKGPIPPVHVNCRSTTLPVLSKKFEFLSEGRTRSAEDGPTTADTTYYEWLGKQSKADQIEVLGPARAKLFNDGGMSAEKFRALQFDRNFKPLTLPEMKLLEPAAFKRAGL